MDVEETKKIIQSKIEAEAVTKQVRNETKSYIHEKQNLREGFKESFEPLISSQDKVKESIDKQQNAMIEQLQKNQSALTKGLDKNRLVITQEFNKMDDGIYNNYQVMKQLKNVKMTMMVIKHQWKKMKKLH